MSECTCPWVDPSLWTTYGSAVEPGSQREPDPECPEHGQPSLTKIANETSRRNLIDNEG